MSNEPITFLASIAPTDGGLKAHGLEGFRVLLDLPEPETPAYVRLLLCRGHVLRVTVEIEEGRLAKRTRTRKRKDTTPEWGDDDGTDASGNP